MGKLCVQNCKKPAVGTTLLSACSSPVLSCCGWAALPRQTRRSSPTATAPCFIALPVIEAILMPVMMAVLASRLWDMEIKGNTTKLLYTLQSRRSLFAGKAVFGHGRSSADGHAGNGRILLLGRVQGYTEAFPAEPWYTGICTLAVDVMLFFWSFC